MQNNGRELLLYGFIHYSDECNPIKLYLCPNKLSCKLTTQFFKKYKLYCLTNILQMISEIDLKGEHFIMYTDHNY